MTLINMVLESLWFLLPGLLANSAPVFVKKLDFLNYPVDFNKKINGKRIFGSHKTYRGYFFGTLTAIIVVYFQKQLYSMPFFNNYSLLDYSVLNFVLIGFLFGFGALFGDSVKSFFKRRVGIKPGHTWFPFDQIDSLFGILLFMAPIYFPKLEYVVLMFAILLILHLSFVFIGYKLGIREKPI